MNFNSLTRVAVIAGAVACVTNGWSVEIWAVDNLGPNNAGTIGDRVMRFDSANPGGTLTIVGDAGVDGLSGLDFDASGNLWAVGGGFGGAGSSLFSINQSTGVATLVGTPGAVLTDLSWNPVLGQMEGVDQSGTLYSVNTANGATTLIGAVTGLGAPLIIGLSTDSSGNRFMHDIVVDNMFSLGNGLSATMMSSPIGLDTNFSQGMTMNHAGANEWYLGAISASPSFASEIRLMDNTTGGTTSIVHNWGLNANGLPEFETGDLAINPVPEPATFVAIGIGLAGLAFARRRK